MDFSGIIAWLQGVFQAIVAFFQKIWGWLVKHIVRHLISVLTTAYDILDGIARSIIQILKTIRTWYIKHILPILTGVINTLQAFREMLALLKLLGVKWAAKLDADIQKIQGYITLSIQDVLGTLNTITSYLDLVVDPSMILRKDFFGASLLSSLGTLKRAVGFGSNAPLSATDQQSEQDSNKLLYQKAPLATLRSDGTADIDPAYQGVLDNIDAATELQLSNSQ